MIWSIMLSTPSVSKWDWWKSYFTVQMCSVQGFLIYSYLISQETCTLHVCTVIFSSHLSYIAHVTYTEGQLLYIGCLFLFRSFCYIFIQIFILFFVTYFHLYCYLHYCEWGDQWRNILSYLSFYAIVLEARERTMQHILNIFFTV